jgi:hypothetical protein
MGKPDFFAEESTAFKKELEESEPYRQRVAILLMQNGLRIEVPPQEYRDGLSDRGRFRNEKDIIVWPGVADHEMVVIEVKSRKEKFDSAENFGRLLRRKYKQSGIFVDTVHGWAQKSPKPKLIFMISQITGAIIVLQGRTQEQWTRGTFNDRRRGYSDTFYKADPELFITVEEAIQKLQKRQERLSPRRAEYGRVKLVCKRQDKLLDYLEKVVSEEGSAGDKLKSISEALDRRIT